MFDCGFGVAGFDSSMEKEWSQKNEQVYTLLIRDTENILGYGVF